MDVDRQNKIMHAVWYGVAMDEVCEDDEERSLYRQLEALRKDPEGTGFEPVADQP